MQQPDIKTALKIYYTKSRIGSKEIHELFDPVGSAMVSKLKQQARKVMKTRDIRLYDTYTVDTACAYEAWGLDVIDLEKRYQKLKKLDFLQ